MELPVQPRLPQPLGEFVDPFGDDEARPRRLLGEEVPHRPADGAGHAHLLADLCQECELPIDLAHLFGMAGGDPGGGGFHGHVQQDIPLRVEEVDKSGEVLVLHGSEEGLAGRGRHCGRIVVRPSRGDKRPESRDNLRSEGSPLTCFRELT